MNESFKNSLTENEKATTTHNLLFACEEKLRNTQLQLTRAETRNREVEADLEALRHKFNNLSKAKEIEREQYLSTQETIRKSQIDREIRDLTVRHNMEKNLISEENQKLKMLVERIKREADDWEIKYNRIDSLLRENTDTTRKFVEYESLNMALSDENKKLKEENAKYSQRMKEAERVAQENILDLEKRLELRYRAEIENMRAVINEGFSSNK